jgi:acetyltransferase-like isoleucine patch superfamily enzyme
MLKKIYLSPLGYIISFLQNIFAFIQQPFMVYGFYNKVQRKFMKLTRVSSSVKIISKTKLDISNNVWIGHYSMLDASNGIKIGKGVQTGPFVSIFSHSSHISIRLLGKSYLQSNERIGYIDGKVVIGDYSFIGTSTTILPNVIIGKGCLIKVGSVITQSVPDYSIVSGNPATIEGSVFEIDEMYFNDKVVQENYFDKQIIENWQKKLKTREI